MEALKEFVEKLPPDLHQEVKDFIEFLLEKRAKKTEVNRSSIGLGRLRTCGINTPR